MSEQFPVPTPWPLLLRRLRYQVVPIVVVLLCASLAGWMWAKQSHTASGSGEVEAVRVVIESKFDGVLDELPRPVNLFDTVESGQVVARLDTRLAQAELARLEEELAELRAASTSGTTRPTQSGVDWYRARIAELKAQLDAGDLKTPISGTVVEIHRRPGEGTQTGKQIMTIASDRASCIIGYLRQDQLVRPTPGMTVTIHNRTKPAKVIDSYVQSAGAQIQLLPTRFWRNPQTPEWGLPIQIALPSSAQLVPGEALDLTIRAAN